MKKIFGLIATCFTFSLMSSHAIVGGPWDNNNYLQANTGTYQATMYMPNGLGMARWTDDTSAQFSLVNQSIVFYRGAVYIGGAFGQVDWAGDKVNGITNGDTVSDFGDSNTGTNIDICNTRFQCNIDTRAPIMRFSGYGQANFFGDLNTFDQETTTSTTVIEGDTETVIETSETNLGGENDDFASSVGHQAQIYVFGSQISATSTTALGLATGAGAGGVGGNSVQAQ